MATLKSMRLLEEAHGCFLESAGSNSRSGPQPIMNSAARANRASISDTANAEDFAPAEGRGGRGRPRMRASTLSA